MRAFVNVALLVGAVVLLFSWSVILYPHLYDPLRKIGVPVPYCFSEKVALTCRYTYVLGPAQVKQVLSSSPVYASLFNPSEDLVNSICSAAENGATVYAFVPSSSDYENMAEQLVSCGVRVKRANFPYLYLASQSGVYLKTPFVSLFTTCKDVVSDSLKRFRERWNSV